MKKTIKLNTTLTNDEELRISVLRRLNKTCVVLPCSSFGVGPAKTGSKDKFAIGFVMRHEFTNTDTPVTIILHKGVAVKEATDALNYVIGAIKEADQKACADKNKKVVQAVKDKGLFAMVCFHLLSFGTTIFTLPGYCLGRLVSYIKRKL